MTRTNTQIRTPDQRIFSSPVALAFVRIVTGRRGVTEAQARKVYLDYISRSRPAARPRASESRAMT